MVYYHIRLSKSASNLCTIIIPWGNNVTRVYQWELLTHQTFFQLIMDGLYHIFKFIRAYIDGLLVLTEGYWTDCVQNLQLTLNELKQEGLKCDIYKSFFGQTEN